jgi:hypothetical protein
MTNPTPSAPPLPPALVLDGGDGVRIEATNHERSSWAVWDGNWCLNSRGRWESEPYASSRDAGYLARAHRAGLAHLIRQRADDYQGQLPQDLANFLNTLLTQ